MGKLGDQYEKLSAETTKEKILLESARLFALNNYDAVTMIDIADAVGLKSGSLYSHYLSKEEILMSIFSKFEIHYKEYFSRVAEANRYAESCEEITANMFAETMEVVNYFSYYVIAILLKEQFRNDKAYEYTSNLLFKYSIEQIKGFYDNMAEKGLTPPIDGQFMATLIMFTIFSTNHMTIQESIGHELPVKTGTIIKQISDLLIKISKAGLI